MFNIVIESKNLEKTVDFSYVKENKGFYTVDNCPHHKLVNLGASRILVFYKFIGFTAEIWEFHGVAAKNYWESHNFIPVNEEIEVIFRRKS